MNKKVIFLVGGIVFLIAASSLYLIFTPKQVSTPTRTASTSDETDVETPLTDTQPAAGESTTATAPATYANYSSDRFTSAKGIKVLFFHADWCPQCRALDADLQANVSSLSDVTVYKVRYDDEIDLRKQYGVTQQTTFVKTDESGNLIDSYVAYDRPNLASVRENLQL